MEQQDALTLYHHINFWGRKRIPSDRAAFQVLEELVLHSFDARVVGLFYTRLEQRGINISDQAEVGAAIQAMEPSGGHPQLGLQRSSLAAIQGEAFQ